MSDENAAPQDDNQEALPDSSPDNTPEPQANPPAEENSAPEKEEGSKFVPYDRFKEVIDEKNQYASRFKELEDRLNGYESAQRFSRQESTQNKALEILTKAGLPKDSAEVLSQAMNEIAKQSVDSRVTPLEQMSVQRVIASWTRDFAQEHSDYEQLKPDMMKIYESLPEAMQNLTVADKAGLEMLYAYAKYQRMDKDVEKARQEGKNEAYKTQKLKGAVSNSPNSSPAPSPNLTPEKIEKMSYSEWAKIRESLLNDPEAMNRLAKS